jgi:hypothetical protein
MNIIEAAKAMMEGKSITRGHAVQKYTADGDDIMTATYYGGGWSSWSKAWHDGAFCSMEELLADDWEIVE